MNKFKTLTIFGMIAIYGHMVPDILFRKYPHGVSQHLIYFL